MLVGSRALLVRKTDNLPPSMSRLSRQCGIVNISQLHRPPRPVMGIASFFLPFYHCSAVCKPPGCLSNCQFYYQQFRNFSLVLNLYAFVVYRPPLWSSGQSSWLQIRRPGFDSRNYKKKVVGLERGPLSLVSTPEELLDRKEAAPV
jgi:hypothetical protein